MERKATELSNVDRLKLADLLVTVRDSAAKDGPVVIYGFADERERNASKRAKSVSDYLQSLGVASNRINVDTKIWGVGSQVPSAKRNQIEVEFEPVCGPNGCENPCGITEPKQ